MAGCKGKWKMAKRNIRKRKHRSQLDMTGISGNTLRKGGRESWAMTNLDGDSEIRLIDSVASSYADMGTERPEKSGMKFSQNEQANVRHLQQDTLELEGGSLPEGRVSHKSQAIQHDLPSERPEKLGIKFSQNELANVRHLHQVTLELEDSLLEGGVFSKSQAIQHDLPSESCYASVREDVGRHRFLKTGVEADADASSDVSVSQSCSARFPHESLNAGVLTSASGHPSPENSLACRERCSVNPHLLEKETAAERNASSWRQVIKPKEVFCADYAVKDENFAPKDRYGMHSRDGHDVTMASSLADQEYSSKNAERSSSTSVTHSARAPLLRRRHNFSDVPSALELEEFFEEDEKQPQIAFMTRYNFDPVNEVPLTGRFDWVRVQHNLSISTYLVSE